MKVSVLYFAWLRERVGAPQEHLETTATTVQHLIAELTARDERYALAFADLSAVRVAVDQVLTTLDAPFTEGSEIAFFPPMTGG